MVRKGEARVLLTITTTYAPATDLGYLLGKNPQRTQSFDLSFGQGHVYYPEASESRCTAALLLDVDPVALIRRRHGQEGFALAQYTNDRPYVCSSFLSVAIGRVFGQALGGRCAARPELAEQKIPLEAKLCVVVLRGGPSLLRKLFEPLGYEVEVQRHPLDEEYREWGYSPYATITLSAQIRLQDLLRHICVLVPVLDDQKHYWVGQAEIEKLLGRGEGWLAQHPARERIADRYLKHQRGLTIEALERLDDPDDVDSPDDPQSEEQSGTAGSSGVREASLEKPMSLNRIRQQRVLETLKKYAVRRVIDLGCGEGKLLRELVKDREFERVAGMDVSITALERAKQRIVWDELSESKRARIELFQGSLSYRDQRLSKYDGACVVEVIEHMDPSRLDLFEQVVFEAADLDCIVLTTPNIEYNARFESLPPGKFRHSDHRFEWSREEFAQWARGVAGRHGYELCIEGIGPEDSEFGAPTQMGVFYR